MNSRHIVPQVSLTTNSHSSARAWCPRTLAGKAGGTWKIALLVFLVTGLTAHAQWVRFRTAQIRATVPAGTTFTNTFVITNGINVSTDIVSAVNFSVSNLPAGTGTTLTDTNGNALLS